MSGLLLATVVAAGCVGRRTLLRSVVRARLTSLDVARVGGSPRSRADPGNALDAPTVLDLLAAAIAGGTSVPGAVVALGEALAGADGAALARAGGALRLGAHWDAAWADVPERLGAVSRALGPTWSHGAAPGPALTAAAARERREREAALAVATARLGVRLVVPLGLCFLPAFVLIGLAPLLLSMVGELLGSSV